MGVRQPCSSGAEEMQFFYSGSGGKVPLTSKNKTILLWRSKSLIHCSGPKRTVGAPSGGGQHLLAPLGCQRLGHTSRGCSQPPTEVSPALLITLLCERQPWPPCVARLSNLSKATQHQHG